MFATPATPSEVIRLVVNNPKFYLAARFLNGRLTPAQFCNAVGGLPPYDRGEVVRHVDALALETGRTLTAEQKACLDWLEASPAALVTDTGDVDPGQLDPVADSTQFLP